MSDATRKVRASGSRKAAVLAAAVLSWWAALSAHATDIVNQAAAQFHDGDPAGLTAAQVIQASALDLTIESNIVRAMRSLPPPSVWFYTSSAFKRQAVVAVLGRPLYLQGNALACANDANAIETVRINIKTQTSNDSESYTATETSAGSGIFRVHSSIDTRRVSSPGEVVHNDHWLELWSSDKLEATLEGCGGEVLPTQILIDPGGVVFDSISNLPVPGAHVRLADVTGAGNGGHAGGDAIVFDYDGLTPAPAEVTVGEDGHFAFPFVAPSTYRLEVTPPGDYHFPSKVAVSELSADRIIHMPGSFGDNFLVDVSTGDVALDVPLDADPGGLFVQKVASRTTAEIGESVQYRIEMRNFSGIALKNMTVGDRLPPGFRYVPGSARLDNEKIADPTGGKGPNLQFTFASFEVGAQATLSYHVLLGPGAAEGDGINRVQLTSAFPARKSSNTGTAKVHVDGGVFDDHAYVLGKIYADCNSNGLQDAGEPGMPRVRLYLEDGSFVDSDSQGQYSFYGLIPRTHVLKVDATTLPFEAKLKILSHRNAGSAATQFVDLQRGELHRADFAIEGCSDELRAELVARTAVGGVISELTSGIRNELKTEETPLGDVRALPASGIVGSNLITPADLPPRKGAPSAKSTTQLVPLQQLLPKLDNSLTFIDLADGDTVNATQISVRIKGYASTDIQLQVNNETVAESRIGTRVTDNPRHLEAREYIGVALQPGINNLMLVQRDVGGNARSIRTINITAPGEMTRIVASATERSIPADGAHSAHIVVELQDAAGVRSGFRAPVTLESTLGDWNVADLDPREPGIQAFVEGGRSEFELRGPATAGVAEVRVASSSNVGIESKTKVEFVPALRPLIGVGVVEGTFSLNDLSPGGLQQARDNDGFERELRQLSSDGDVNGGARAALFLKGKVRGDYLLTLGYDSDKDTQERLYRDIQPDRFYPVYGDSSVKGFDAQSSSKLYVRIDKNRSYLLVGDYTTQALDMEARKLGAYNRSLNGITEHYERGALAVRGFASHDNARHVVDEIPANGTSGPYALSSSNALENSEQVEILVRDRDQPAVIISATPQQRFSDYEIEPFTGRLLFRSPVPSVDADLNPISIRISYDVEQGGENFWTGGIDGRIKVTRRIEVGAALIEDRNPDDQQRIASANATIKLGEVTTLIAEAARTQRDEVDEDKHDGIGARLDLKHEGTKTQLRAYAIRADEGFDNPSGYMSGDRSEAGAKAAHSVTERTRLLAEGLHTGDVSTGAKRDGALLGIEHSFAHNVKLETGVRHVIDTPGNLAPPEFADKTDTTSARIKLTTPVPGLKRASVFAEYEQDLSNPDQRLAALGGEYYLFDRTRLYARQEMISSLSGPYGLDPNQRHNTTVFGLDSSYLGDDHMFSEYRVGDGLSGREAQAAIGLRNRWSLSKGLRLDTTLERVDALSGAPESESNALTTAIEYTRNPLWKATARLELRDGATSNGLLSTLGIAYKLTQDWTFLGKNVFAITDNNGIQPDREQERLQLGVAYRDSQTNRLSALARYEFKSEEGVEPGVLRRVHMFSTHMDYQLRKTTVVRGQLAAKWAQESFLDLDMHGDAQLIAVRVTQDIGKRWDLGFATRALIPGSFSTYQGGLGTELGFLVKHNLWLSLGFNVFGFHDEDLQGDDYTRRGLFVRLRFKFDESLLGGQL